MTSPWTHMRRVFEHCGSTWPQLAALDPITAPFITLSRERSYPIAYSNWGTVVRHARLSSASRACVDADWLAAMSWYSAAVMLVPDAWLAKVSDDARMRDLAKRDKHRYGPCIAPVLSWAALESCPDGGRWDEARWITLLIENAGPYATRRLVKP